MLINDKGLYSAKFIIEDGKIHISRTLNNY
jgi:hypothetical protein